MELALDALIAVLFDEPCWAFGLMSSERVRKIHHEAIIAEDWFNNLSL
jgi:hypothetical protein